MDNKQRMSLIYEHLFNRGDAAIAAELVAEQVVEHSALSGFPAGRDGLLLFVQMLRTGFPDAHFTVDVMLSEESAGLVSARWTMTGTHNGSFFGIPATGRRVRITGIDIARFEAGWIIETWANADLLALMQQLGALPPPTALPAE